METFNVFLRRWVDKRLPSTYNDQFEIPNYSADNGDIKNDVPHELEDDDDGNGVKDTTEVIQPELIEERSRLDDNSEEKSFSVSTYNILTDHCIRSGQYLYCPADNRYMSSRHPHIMAEIATFKPDVVCFQEADAEHFRLFLSPDMDGLGYSGVNCATTDDQGLATFWKRSVFTMIKYKEKQLQKAFIGLLKKSNASDSVKASLAKWFERPEVTTCVQLRHLTTGQCVVLSNVHVAWIGLKFPVLQALQISLTVREMMKFVVDLPKYSLVFCGDFNNPPSFPGYQLLSNGRISRRTFDKFIQENIDIDEVDRTNFCLLTNVIPDIFQLQVHLESAYYSALGHEPRVTNCDGAHEDEIVRPLCVDYIWFYNLDVVSVLETPSFEAIVEHVALPSVNFPSDHLPLVAKFLLRN